MTLSGDTATEGIPMKVMGQSLQGGQALVETCVVCLFVLVPFFVLLPLLAKYQDIRQATVAASRTAAFECAVYADECSNEQTARRVAEQLRSRHFSQGHIALRSDNVSLNERPGQEGNPFWVGNNGDPLIKGDQQVSLKLAHERFDAIKAGHGLIDRLAGAAGDIAGPSRFGLSFRNSIFSAQVQSRVPMDISFRQKADVKQDGGVSERPVHELTFNSQVGILADAWNASSAKGQEGRSMQSRVDRGRRLPSAGDLAQATRDALHFMPAAVANHFPDLDPDRMIEFVHKPLVDLIHAQRPLARGKLPRFEYHKVDVEIVPADRLPGDRGVDDLSKNR